MKKASWKSKKKKGKHKDSLKHLWENIKHTYVYIIGIPREEREEGAVNLFEEIKAENFSNLVKETDIQVQEAQRVSNRMNSESLTPRHIVINSHKLKIKREY